MAVQLDNGFETVSSSLIALPSADYRSEAPEAASIRWLYANGSPKTTPYLPLTLDEA